MADPLDQYLSLKEVARSAGVSPKTIRRMVRDGRFPPPFRFLGHLNWRQSVVAEWLVRTAIKNEIDPADIFGGTGRDSAGQGGTSAEEAEKPASKPGKRG